MDKLIFKKLSETAKLPTRAHPSDAGLDLYADDTLTVFADHFAAVGTGVAVAVPVGYYGRVAPRSGLAVKKGIDVLAGVIDASYRGEIRVVLRTSPTSHLDIKPGDRIAQLIIEKIETPEAVWGEIEDTDRGAGGFGSTGS